MDNHPSSSQPVRLHMANGDDSTFEVLFLREYQSHRRAIELFFAGQRLRSSAVDDLTQEVFLRAWAGQGSYRERASLRAWLFGIAQNVLFEWRRARQPAQLQDEELHQSKDTVVEELLETERAQAIQNVVTKLPPKQQEAITLVYFEGLKPTDAATKADCNDRAFCQRLVDARLQLRRLLAGEHE